PVGSAGTPTDTICISWILAMAIFQREERTFGTMAISVFHLWTRFIFWYVFTIMHCHFPWKQCIPSNPLWCPIAPMDPSLGTKPGGRGKKIRISVGGSVMWRHRVMFIFSLPGSRKVCLRKIRILLSVGN